MKVHLFVKFDRSNAQHELHFIDAPDAWCKGQLKERSKRLPAGSPWTTDAEFKAITLYFQPPSDDEGVQCRATRAQLTTGWSGSASHI